MNLFSKLRQSFQANKIKRVKKDDRKLPKSKGNGKGSRFIVWFILIVIILLSPLAFLRAQTALDKSKNTENTIEAMGKDNQDKEVNPYESPMLEVFTNNFVDEYLTIPKSNEDRSNHIEKMKNYLAEDVSTPDFSDFKGYRELNNKTLYDVSHEKDKAIMSYLVEYENVSIKEVEETKGKGDDKKTKTVEKEMPSKQTAILNVPVRANDNGGYAVVESPYYSNVPDIANASDIDKIANPLTDKENLNTNQTQEIRAWIETFLADYASNTAEDMTYIMDEPKGLNGLQEFVSLEKLKAYPTDKDNRYTIKVVAIFKETEVPITHRENLTLIVEKQDNKFFVKEMNNTLGGN